MGPIHRVDREVPRAAARGRAGPDGGLTRLGGLIDDGYAGLEFYRKAIEKAARRLGLEMFHAGYRSEGDFDAALETLATQRAQAVFVYGSSGVQSLLPRAIRFFAAHKLPDMYIYREAVAAGGLMSYGVEIADLYARAAGHVDRILRGAKPFDLPVELPTKYEMAVNLRAARALGLKLPRTILVRADQLIE